MASKNIPLDWALNITVGAVRQGVSEEKLLTQCYIEREFGDGRDMISHAQYVLLSLTTAVCLEDGLQGLGQKPMEAAFCPLTVRIIGGCKTLDDAIHALGQFFRLAAPSLHVGLRVDHDEAAMTIHADSADPQFACTLEGNHMGWLSLCLSHFLGRRLPLLGITTRDPTHALNRPYWSLRGPVSLGTVTALRFPTSMLSAPRVGSVGREAFWDCIRSYFPSAEREVLHGWRDAGELNGRPLRLGELARRARVSPSTMRRRFDPQEGGFRGARQRAIVEAAAGMLRTSEDSVESIAVELGYADARSLRRLIKNTTGKTPAELRKGDASPSEGISQERIYRRIHELTTTLDR